MVKVGDTVYFSSVSILVNEGTVEAIEGPYLKVKSKCPGTKYVMANQAFTSREELRNSSAYHSAWFEKQRRDQMRFSTTRMASLWR